MNEAQFPPAVTAALDRLTVPAIPAGFADRLLARVAAGDMPPDIGQPLPAKSRTSSGRFPGWRRIGGIGATVAALGLATATAAASGAFGDPVYVPVVSDVLAKVDLVELPKKSKPDPAKRQKAGITSSLTPQNAPKPPPVDGKAAVRDLIRSKWQDPEFRKLPKAERQSAMRVAMRTAIESGRFTKEDLRAVSAEARIEREEKRIHQGQRKPEVLRQKLRERVAAERQLYEEAPFKEKEVLRDKYRQTATLRKRLRALREQLRQAPAGEQPAIRREIRAIRQQMEQAGAVDEKAIPNEGNGEAER
jgi:hypothetical protein